jgi:capsular polysaccharide transport system permease protein
LSETQTPALPMQANLKPPRFQAARAILALILREMASTYGASPGGYIWAVLQPVGTLMIMALGFSLLVRTPALGTSFFLFYATGFLPFDMYNTISGKIESALKYARSLLAYPRMSWIDAVLSRFILHALTLTAVFCIVTGGVLLILDVHVTISVIPIVQGLSMAFLLGLGVGLINSVLSGLFPVWQTIWAIISRPLFLASGIFYIYEDLPRAVQDILWWNPVLHVVGLVREGFYYTYEPAYVSMSYGYGVSLVLIVFGLIFMRSNYARILEN